MINDQALRQLEADVGAEMMPMILQQFHQELAQRATNLAAALEAADLAGLRAEAHSVKSTARTVGLDAVADAAAETESAATAQDRSQTLAHARQLLVLCQQGQQLLSERL